MAPCFFFGCSVMKIKQRPTSLIIGIELARSSFVHAFLTEISQLDSLRRSSCPNPQIK